MAKRKAAEPPPDEDISQEVGEQDDSQETPEHHAVSEQAGGKKIVQADLVRAALAEGIESPREAVEWIRKNYNFEMKTTGFSATKAQLKHREGGEPRTPRHSPAPQQSPASASVPQNFGADVRAIKELLEEAGGADQLRDLAAKIGMLTQKYGVSGMNDLIQAFE